MPRLDDYGHELAEESLRKLERRFASIYSKAARDMREKQEKEMAAYQRELSQRLKALDDTPEAKKKHEDWLAEQAMRNRWVGDMSDRLAKKATEGNELAMQALNDTLPTVYAENANWAAYTVDKAVGYDTSFTLVDADTVRNLVTGSASTEAVGSVYERLNGATSSGGRLLPEITFPVVDRRKDYRWNRQRFNSAITQGILQGESIPNIVKRTESIFGMNKAAATRAARTATTCAENSGRISSYERAKGMGIELKQEWVAALDGRTRESHRKLDGVKVAVGEEFEAERGKLRFPGDPQGHPSEVYNCRCTLVAAVDGVDQEDAARWSRLPDGMTYDEWREGKPIDRAESYKNPARIKEPGWARKSSGSLTGGLLSTEEVHRAIDALPGVNFLGNRVESTPENPSKLAENPVPYVGYEKSERVMQAFEEAKKEGAPKNLESVDVNALLSTQAGIYRRNAHEILNSGMEEFVSPTGGVDYIEIFEYMGRLYVIDGNHRTAIYRLRGDREITAMVTRLAM